MTWSSIRQFAVAAFLACFAGASHAEYRVMTPDDIPGWEAVGRVTFSRIGAPYTCTGTLIAPDKVLTAAHCVSRQFGKGPAAARHLIFQAGKSGTFVIETKGVARISYHPDYEPGSGLNNTVPSDLAVLHLVEPMEIVAPAMLAGPPDPLEFVSFLAHRANGRNPPRLTEDCSQRRVAEQVIELGCRAIKGNSGAGVFVETDEGRKLVAVMSAAGEARSYATIPDEWLDTVLQSP